MTFLFRKQFNELKTLKSNSLIIGQWTIDAPGNRISRDDTIVELEPRVMDLLMLFAARAGTVISKDEIVEAIWDEVHVNDDALTRCVFKLRKALEDNARHPQYIETVSKRGYRLIADVSSPRTSEAAKSNTRRFALVAITAISIGFGAFLVLNPWFSAQNKTTIDLAKDDLLIVRADGFYSQYTRSDNEAATRIYEAVLADDPENAKALAGLSNAIAQRVIRYEGLGSDGDLGRRSLTAALESGWLNQPAAQDRLQRSIVLARKAAQLDPRHTRAWRALGLAQSAVQDYESAQRAYEKALIIDPEDWGTMINLSELSRLTGRPENSVSYLEQAWFSMERKFVSNPVAIRPWHSSIGLAVADHHAEAKAWEESKLWFQRVLSRDPLNAEAVRGLAEILRHLGDVARAQLICEDLAAATTQTC